MLSWIRWRKASNGRSIWAYKNVWNWLIVFIFLIRKWRHGTKTEGELNSHLSDSAYPMRLERNGNGKHILDRNYSLVPHFNVGFNGNNICLLPLLPFIDHRWIRTVRSVRSVQRYSAKQRRSSPPIPPSTCFLPRLLLHIGKNSAESLSDGPGCRETKTFVNFYLVTLSADFTSSDSPFLNVWLKRFPCDRKYSLSISLTAWRCICEM